MKLSELQTGEKAVIVRVHGHGSFRKRLIEMGYARRSGKAIESTSKGDKLISAVPREISSPETTGKWERALSRMAHSQDPAIRAQKFMDSIRRYSAFLVESADRAPGVVFEREAPKARPAPRRAPKKEK